MSWLISVLAGFVCGLVFGCWLEGRRHIKTIERMQSQLKSIREGLRKINAVGFPE